MSNSQNGGENPRTPLNSAYDLPEQSQQLYVYALEHNASSGVKVFEITQKPYIAEFKTIDEGYQFLRMCSLARLSPEQAGAAAMFFQKQAAEEQEASVKELTEERDDLKEELKRLGLKLSELGAINVLIREDHTRLKKALQASQDFNEKQRADIDRLSTSNAALVTRLEKEKRWSIEGTKDIKALQRAKASLEKQLEKAHKDLEAAHKLAEKHFEDFTRTSMYSLRQEDIIAKLKAGLV